MYTACFIVINQADIGHRVIYNIKTTVKIKMGKKLLPCNFARTLIRWIKMLPNKDVDVWC